MSFLLRCLVLLTVGFNPDLPLMVCDPVPDLELQHLSLAAGQIILKSAVECVRGLLIIIEHKVAAQSRNTVRKAHTQSPPCQVHLVNSLVADVPVAVTPKPVPVVMKTILCKAMVRRRAGPQIIVHTRRYRLDSSMADSVSPFETQAA